MAAAVRVSRMHRVKGQKERSEENGYLHANARRARSGRADSKADMMHLHIVRRGRDRGRRTD